MGLVRRILVAVFVFGIGAAAMAQQLRGVYANSQVHISSEWGGNRTPYLTHQAGVPDAGMVWRQVGPTQQVDIPITSSGEVCYGFGQTIFNNRIYIFPVGHPAGQHSSDGRYMYCVPFDLGTGQFDASKMVSLGDVNKTLAAVSSAAVTFSPKDEGDSQIFVFNDTHTWSSGDGVNWSPHDPLAPPHQMLEPLDAIVYYPPDSDPVILVVYQQAGLTTLTNGLWAATWNGKFGSDSQSTLTQISSTPRYFEGALFLGTVAAKPPYHQGSTKPCVQLFALPLDLIDFSVKRWEYEIGSGTWTQDSGGWPDPYGSCLPEFVFPWFTTECSKSTTNHIQRQHLVLNSLDVDNMPCDALDIPSDAMVPINSGLSISCSAWGGEPNSTEPADSDQSDDAKTMRKYWTLIGVILGTPPFALNGWEGFELEPFSNLEIGAENQRDITNSQTTESSVICSSGTSVWGGLGKKKNGMLTVKDEFDFSWKEAWESTHEASTSFQTTFDMQFGTEQGGTENPETLGQNGWAIFSVPQILVQDYRMYAYSYDVDNPSEELYLNQDLHAVEALPDSSNIEKRAFRLNVPGSPDDTVEGLMAGMSAFPVAQDLDNWSDPGFNWESKTGPWYVLLGENADTGSSPPEQKINQLNWVEDAGSSVGFSQGGEEVNTSGATSTIELSDTLAVSLQLGLFGFKQSLTGGYDSEFSQETSTKTSWDKNVNASLHMKTAMDPNDPAAIKSLNVQPYFLLAKDSTAPWIPDAYRNARPWCITWQVKQHSHYNGDGSIYCPPPPWKGRGEIIGGDGGNPDGSGPVTSSMSVIDACMDFGVGSGEGMAVPVGADDFDPALGAMFKLNGYSYSTSQAKGKWAREGDVWKFKTKESAKPRVLLKLDFGSRTWDLELSKADLNAHFQPSKTDIRLALTLNGRFSFFSTFKPEIRTKWDIKVPVTSSDKVTLTRYSGEYDSATGEGSVILKGTLPKNPETFGDMSFSVNGHQFNASLISLKDFEEAVTKGKELVYDNGGLRLVVHFGKGTWKARFHKEGFHPLFAPRWGNARIRIAVGGVTVYSQEHDIKDHTTKFSFTS